VKYGLSLPTGGECGDPRFLLELGERAEQAGWDGVFLEDYVSYQGNPTAPTCNSWVVLGAIAVRTERIRLGTMVTPLARRRPWNVAREAAGIDQLSVGRMILGVGVGDTGESVTADASFVRLGEERDPRQRAELLDEGLEIIAGLWSGEPFSFEGKHFRVEELTFRPPPVQQPRIPIWIGGGYPNPRPTQRAARWDGACLFRDTHGGPWEDMAPEDVRALRAAAGTRPYTIAVGGRGREDDWDSELEHIRAVADASADWWIEWVPPGDREGMRESVKRGPLQIG
jgi:alkanesulfonate monooxygenase SsuD/methylene tetrahydromethanopterin reductase-like flavin-dependent oxidoreductase (luciferase family)